MSIENNPLAVLWIGRCTIYEYQEVTDPITYQTSHKLVPVVYDEPCRVSYRRVTYNTHEVVNLIDGVPYVEQVIMLIIRPDLTIREGSVIEVTQHNVTTKYKRSNVPAIYTHHQEVPLDFYEDFAR